MDEIIQAFYQFSNKTGFLIANNTTKAKISIICNQPISFSSVNFHLRYDIKGKLNVGSKTPLSIQLDNNKNWVKDNTQEYEIEFKTPNTPISFSGENLEIVWYLIVEVIVDDRTKSQIRSQLLRQTKLISLAKTYNGKIITKHPIKVRNIDCDYQIVNFEEISYQRIHIPLLFGGFILATDVLLYLSGSYHIIISSIAAILSIGLLGYALYKYITIGLLGEVRLVGEYIDEKKFRICVIPKKNLKTIIGIKLFYTITEEVIDNRGS
ncbi:hypothetical protein [uncultured Aquimarina sp.]|uniref:hypothetical protein n=1 Tax=uncultured Aquimarina sp. TaxID=575652 RepID=UPI002631C319|nr:hypothetical protein [uncultured Aquimarina sp.]